jgi:hypothetical protein
MEIDQLAVDARLIDTRRAVIFLKSIN